MLGLTHFSECQPCFILQVKCMLCLFRISDGISFTFGSPSRHLSAVFSPASVPSNPIYNHTLPSTIHMNKQTLWSPLSDLDLGQTLPVRFLPHAVLSHYDPSHKNFSLPRNLCQVVRPVVLTDVLKKTNMTFHIPEKSTRSLRNQKPAQ